MKNHSYRQGLKLQRTAADAGTLKLLRKWFPDRSLPELRQTVGNHGYVYLTDAEPFHADGERKLARLLKECDGAGIGTELYEEVRSGGVWRARPMSRDCLRNALRRSREIERETLIDIERETEGFVSPEALADIEAETAAHWDGADLEL